MSALWVALSAIFRRVSCNVAVILRNFILKFILVIVYSAICIAIYVVLKPLARKSDDVRVCVFVCVCVCEQISLQES